MPTRFIMATWLALLLVCSAAPAAPPRVLVLGIDGMDYGLTDLLLKAGRLPNLERLAKSGTFMPLQTTTPPQSPVAWSTFAVGAGPGVHGIADFIARDPRTMLPEFSMSRVIPPGASLSLGSYSFPLKSGTVELLRKGRPFWDLFSDKKIPARIIRLPANFPPSLTCPTVQCLSGMGTPDLLGGYGTFTFYTSAPDAQDASISGGRIRRLELHDGEATGSLPGPENQFRIPPAPTEVELRFFADEVNDVVKIEFQDQQLLLNKGEWSEWLPVQFKMRGGFSDARGMCRFYVKSVHPVLAIYVSPVNIDPLNPALPISSPPDMSRKLAETNGRFYTQGMPEDTKALSAGIFSDDEYCSQSQMVLKESTRMFETELKSFHEGLLFYYFSTIDQCSHAFWRQQNPNGPGYDKEAAARYGGLMEHLYQQMDAIVGQAMECMNKPDDVVLIMSDHGFASFAKEVELNQWLRKEGYLVVKPEARLRDATFADVDWGKTRAYNLGLNSIYLNIAGREKNGIVPPQSAGKLAQEIIGKLKALRDVQTGTACVSNAWPVSEVYSGPEMAGLPDIIVGFAPPYRISWKSALGNIATGAVVKPNTDHWSADHCCDPTFVPGVLFCSRALPAQRASLQDLAPTILDLYGIAAPQAMTGHSLLHEPTQKKSGF